MSGVLAPVPGLDFTAIDFETANGFRGSPCALGAVRVRDGVMVERAEWLIRPPVGFDRFDPRNVRIHGITEDRVLDAPRFAQVYDELADFVGTDVLAAHNAGFDVGVIESGLEVSGRDVPGLEFVCTLVLARRVYDLPSYALPSAAREAGLRAIEAIRVAKMLPIPMPTPARAKTARPAPMNLAASVSMIKTSLVRLCW